MIDGSPPARSGDDLTGLVLGEDDDRAADNQSSPYYAVVITGQRTLRVGTYTGAGGPAVSYYADYCVVALPERRAVRATTVVAQPPNLRSGEDQTYATLWRQLGTQLEVAGLL